MNPACNRSSSIKSFDYITTSCSSVPGGAMPPSLIMEVPPAAFIISKIITEAQNYGFRLPQKAQQIHFQLPQRLFPNPKGFLFRLDRFCSSLIDALYNSRKKRRGKPQYQWHHQMSKIYKEI